MCEPLIHEFYANAILQEDEFDCHFIRGHEFTIDLEDIDDVLGFEHLEHDFTHYKDIMLSIKMVQSHISGVREGRSLNTTAFPPDLRCLTLIMMFNLYLVKKMTTISNARAIFLMELRENTYIDISAHAFSIIADETRTTSRAKLILPSLLMRLFQVKDVEIPQDISLMPTLPTINALTIARIKVHLLGDERRVIKYKENLWTLRQKQKDKPQAHKGVVKGVELHHLL